MQRLVLAAATFLASAAAIAGEPITHIPEPGIAELLGIAAVVGAVVAIRNRRNK